ncbi:hypothetical protein PSU4_54290 [Pseudonocardia sulfidoxydans NBRC 16205]|uniref:HTH cro/C1-type domain-containing protein n=1 Tax=Pseudonocardia sulfidoxydans NBRC 16205 TaxID=1223511 RepID=A0A511DNU7_9PSEU|nr:helix-turn-helix transcriptional regulator [Pseudonocardia sulfidoxydans]GEL26475.1 hypothetical protein PSU4_54290 [Pseudonocardia sulfidoxydans NBRC 16205]
MTDERSPAEPSEAERIAAAQERQRELYGAPVGERVRRITGGLGVTQGRLARALGLSPAMLSQLVSGRRVKIGDPAVLGRLMLLDARVPPTPPSKTVADALLADVGAARPSWSAPGPGTGKPGACGTAGRVGGRVIPLRPGRAVPVAGDGAVAVTPAGIGIMAAGPRHVAAEALRSVTGAARLVAAAALLDPAFPELADVLRIAAVQPR